MTKREQETSREKEGWEKERARQNGRRGKKEKQWYIKIHIRVDGKKQ